MTKVNLIFSNRENPLPREQGGSSHRGCGLHTESAHPVPSGEDLAPQILGGQFDCVIYNC